MLPLELGDVYYGEYLFKKETKSYSPCNEVSRLYCMIGQATFKVILGLTFAFYGYQGKLKEVAYLYGSFPVPYNI